MKSDHLHESSGCSCQPVTPEIFIITVSETICQLYNRLTLDLGFPPFRIGHNIYTVYCICSVITALFENNVTRNCSSPKIQFDIRNFFFFFFNFWLKYNPDMVWQVLWDSFSQINKYSTCVQYALYNTIKTWVWCSKQTGVLGNSNTVELKHKLCFGFICCWSQRQQQNCSWHTQKKKKQHVSHVTDTEATLWLGAVVTLAWKHF